MYRNLSVFIYTQNGLQYTDIA